MWIFTREGFVSVVRYSGAQAPLGLLPEANRISKANPGQDLLLVRARTKKHLERMLAYIEAGIDEAAHDKVLGRYKGSIPESPRGLPLWTRPKIMADLGTDYGYRAVLPAWAVSYFLASSAEEMDYTNFKDAAHDETVAGWDDALKSVWATMHRLQLEEQARGRQDFLGPLFTNMEEIQW